MVQKLFVFQATKGIVENFSTCLKLKKQGFNRDLDIEQQLESALAEKILTPAEVEQFLKAQKFHQDAMQVDAF